MNVTSSVTKSKKNISFKEYLNEMLEEPLSHLIKLQNDDDSYPIKLVAKNFIYRISYPTKNIDYFSEGLIYRSFVIAYKIAQESDTVSIDYFMLISKLHSIFPGLTKEYIKETLKHDFDTWISQFDGLKEKYPRASFTTLLKVFAENLK